MAKRRTDSEIRRALYRRVPRLSWGEVEAIRDRLTRYLIADRFKSGRSIETLSSDQKVWSESDIQAEIRAYMRLDGRGEAS